MDQLAIAYECKLAWEHKGAGITGACDLCSCFLFFTAGEILPHFDEVLLSPLKVKTAINFASNQNPSDLYSEEMVFQSSREKYYAWRDK